MFPVQQENKNFVKRVAKLKIKYVGTIGIIESGVGAKMELKKNLLDT